MGIAVVATVDWLGGFAHLSSKRGRDGGRPSHLTAKRGTEGGAGANDMLFVGGFVFCCFGSFVWPARRSRAPGLLTQQQLCAKLGRTSAPGRESGNHSLDTAHQRIWAVSGKEHAPVRQSGLFTFVRLMLIAPTQPGA